MSSSRCTGAVRGVLSHGHSHSTDADVTLMDLRLPDMSGIEAISAIRTESPNARIIVLTTYAGDAQAAAALKAGAAGYLLKTLVTKELVETIRAVHAGKRRVPPEIATEIAEHVADDALTEREIEVLRRVAAGKSNKVIAAELDISEGTVKNHMKSILPKLDASDRTHAVMIALKRGISTFDRRPTPLILVRFSFHDQPALFGSKER